MGMTQAIYEPESRTALFAVARAARLCRAVQREIKAEILAKNDQSPVTIADFGSQALIGQTLAQAFPGDPILAEENSSDLVKPENEPLLSRATEYFTRFSTDEGREPTAAKTTTPGARESLIQCLDHGAADHGGKRFWTVDPIDGTKGFLRGGQYAVALALIVDGRVVVAALACPNLDFRPASNKPGTLFYAIRGAGAYMISEDQAHQANPTAERIRVSDRDDLRFAQYCESYESSHSAQDESATIAKRLGITSPSLRMDSQAKYAVVARGEADLYLRLPTRKDYREKIWDHAAGALLVEEAGGTVTDITGRPLEFHHGRELVANQGVVVSNGRFHQAVIAAINARR